ILLICLDIARDRVEPTQTARLKVGFSVPDRRGSHDPRIFDCVRFSALPSQAPFIPRPPIYAGVERTSVSRGQRMPTSRPGKFTVIRTENEPIFLYRRVDFKPGRGAHFAGMQSAANFQYALQTTGVN